MVKTKLNPPRMTVEVVYRNGQVDSSLMFARDARRQFEDIVSSCLCYHSTFVREIRLLDSANRVYKSYTQHY